MRAWAARMLDALDLREAELSVLLCDDATIRALNRDYRRKDRATDVLAFAMREGRAAPPTRLLGDVVVSLETAARQARGARRPTSDEVRALLAHGLLHLLGFDHRDRLEARRMEMRTDALVSASRRSRAGKGGAPSGPPRAVEKGSRRPRRG